MDDRPVRARTSGDFARQSAKCCSPGVRLLPRADAYCELEFRDRTERLGTQVVSASTCNRCGDGILQTLRALQTFLQTLGVK